jgi:hypothetical protein
VDQSIMCHVLSYLLRVPVLVVRCSTLSFSLSVLLSSLFQLSSHAESAELAELENARLPLSHFLLLKLKSVTRYCVLEIHNIVSLPLLPLPTCQLHPTLESQTSPSLLLPRRSVTSLSLIKYSLPGIDACWCSCLCLSRQSPCR